MTPLLWTAYVVLPAAGWGWLSGIPIGLFGAIFLFAIWWTWNCGNPPPGRRVLVALLLLKLAASFLLVDRGLSANYFANERWTFPQEQSTEFRSRDFTRIDTRLSFGLQGAPDLPLYFFNDFTRFADDRPGEPARQPLPFSATWQGYVWNRVPKDREMFYLHGNGVKAELWVDAVQTVSLDPSKGDAVDRARWPAGMRNVIVRVSSPPGGGREFEAGFIDPNGRKTPFGEAVVLTRPYARWRIVLDRIIRMAGTTIDTVLLLILLVCVLVACLRVQRACRKTGGPERQGAWVALGWLAAFAAACVFAGPALDALTLRPGGSDGLTYETYARDIVLHGPPMSLGGAIGRAEPFDYQPIYAYFLALTHLVFGEDLFGILVVQYLLVWVTFLSVRKMSVVLFGDKVGLAALALAAVFLAVRVLPMASFLLSENLFIPLVTVWVLSMIGIASPSTETHATMRAGLSGGLATLMRSTLVAGWVLALPLVTRARRRAGMPFGRVMAMFVVLIAVLSVATLTNKPGPPPFALLTPSLRPALFVLNLADRALYALGFFSTLTPGAENSATLIMFWTAAAVGMWLAASPGVGEGLAGPARWLPLAVAVSHLLGVIIIAPHTSGDRLVLPLYVLLLPYVAVTAAYAAGLLADTET